MEKVRAYIELYINSVTLSISVDNNLEKLNGRMANLGYIQISDGTIGSEECFWDNLSYFFDIDAEKKKEIKTELKEKGLYYPGIIKEIKQLIKEAKRLNLLTL